ncbi:MAG: cytidylate kinase-like family protein [Lachnospiraceae bacterium]|nr:cytidylate kinase-like family protein [Lachnospiraceae bacterium]
MKHTIITISRQYGSGGRDIGHLISKHLDIPCYDRSIIDKTAIITCASTWDCSGCSAVRR